MNAERRTPNAERRTPNAERRTPNEARAQRARCRLAWLGPLALLAGLWLLAAATWASGQILSPPVDAYYWVGTDSDATAPANWEALGSTGALPSEGAHLVFNPNADEPEQTINGFGDAALPTHYGSLWIDTGPSFTIDANGYYDQIYYGYGDYYYETTLSGTAITLGFGTEEIDRLLVARGFGPMHLDLDIAIHTAGGLPFRIHNGLHQLFEDTPVALYFEKTLTSHGPLIVDGWGNTFIDTLLGTGTLLKDGTGTLRVSDSSAYTGDVTIRGGIFAGELAASARLALGGGIYELFDDGSGGHGPGQRALGSG